MLPIVLIVALALLAMGRLCGHEFTNWDDDATVARNPDFNPPTWSGVMRYWREPFMDLYVPVTYMVWGVVAAVAHGEGGLEPRVFHTFNVLLHTANAVLLFLLLRRLIGPPRTWAAAAGAALFAVHPVQVETVGWVSGMKDLLCGFLTLLALWAYVAYAQASAAPESAEAGADADADARGRRRRWGYYALATAAFALAMLSKPTAVVTPAMAGVIDWLVLRRPLRAVVASLAPWAVLAVPCVIWTKRFQSAEHLADVVPPLWQRALIALDALAFYLGKLVFPARLALDYGRNPVAAIAKGWIYYTWIVPAAVALGLLLFRRRIPTAVVAGTALAVLGLLPVLGLVPFDFQAYSTVADHYLYLPMAGVALVAAALLAGWPANRWGAAAGAVLLILAVRSMVQTGVWHDSVALFRHSLSVNPDSAAVHNGLAAALVVRGRPHDAIPVAREAVRLNPSDARSHVTLASALGGTGRLAEAEASYREALRIDPNNSVALGNLAGIVAQQKRVDEALALVRRALEIDPNEANARLNLGILLDQQGRYAEAAPELAAAARALRTPQAYFSAGVVMARAGRLAEARQHLEAALRLEPNLQAARAVLAEVDRMQRSQPGQTSRAAPEGGVLQ